MNSSPILLVEDNEDDIELTIRAIEVLRRLREERSYSLGANSYVRKPVGFSEFSEAVKVP